VGKDDLEGSIRQLRSCDIARVISIFPSLFLFPFLEWLILMGKKNDLFSFLGRALFLNFGD